MGSIRTYRDLIVWQKAMCLAEQIYQYTDDLPRQEQYGLASQLRRAAVSVPSNIAEGYARGTSRDYLKHLRIARGSLAEMSTQLQLVVSLAFAEEDGSTWDLLNEVDRVLQGLIMKMQMKCEAKTASVR